MSDLVRDYGVNPRVIAHVGAHKGEEHQQYLKVKPTSVYWFEANPDQVTYLSERFQDEGTQHVVHGAVWDTDDETLDFKITNNTLSSSLFDLGEHSKKYPDIVSEREISVKTLRLDTFFAEKQLPDFINLDIQGAELQALKGAALILHSVSHIYTEVSHIELYLGAPLAGEMDLYLTKLGFKKVMTRKLPKDGWGDVLYINTNLASLPKWRVLARLLGNFSHWASNQIYGVRLAMHHVRKSSVGS
jgi:FkbM family methyltransferase